MIESLLHHWPEYLIEGALLGIFMAAACVAVVVLEHPASPIRRRIASPGLRRSIIGVLMGLTAVALIYSSWGQRSGAHMNPATTLTFLVLGKVRAWDAGFYILAQFAGGLAGVLLPGLAAGRLLRHGSVNFAVTIPGPRGRLAAWIGEFVISLAMMCAVLAASNSGAAPFTGFYAGLLLAVFIAVEAPLSGMSLNPARTLASALAAREFRGLWIYFTAPPLAMLAAAGVYASVQGGVRCAKLSHGAGQRCIFVCGVGNARRGAASPAGARGISHGDRRPHAAGR